MCLLDGPTEIKDTVTYSLHFVFERFHPAWLQAGYNVARLQSIMYVQMKERHPVKCEPGVLSKAETAAAKQQVPGEWSQKGNARLTYAPDAPQSDIGVFVGRRFDLHAGAARCVCICMTWLHTIDIEPGHLGRK